MQSRSLSGVLTSSLFRVLVSTDLECLLVLEKMTIFPSLVNPTSFLAVVIAHHVLVNCVSVPFASHLL